MRSCNADPFVGAAAAMGLPAVVATARTPATAAKIAVQRTGYRFWSEGRRFQRLLCLLRLTVLVSGLLLLLLLLRSKLLLLLLLLLQMIMMPSRA